MSQIDKQGLSEDWEKEVRSWYRAYSENEKLLVLNTQERMIEFIDQLLSKAIVKARDDRDKEIIAYLKKIESESWSDADHCSCLRYAIYHLENPQYDGMVYASKEALSKKEL
jgi:hypothetical protein